MPFVKSFIEGDYEINQKGILIQEIAYKPWLPNGIHYRIIAGVRVILPNNELSVCGSVFVNDILKIFINGIGSEPQTVGGVKVVASVRIFKFVLYTNSHFYGWNVLGLSQAHSLRDQDIYPVGVWEWYDNCKIFGGSGIDKNIAFHGIDLLDLVFLHIRTIGSSVKEQSGSSSLLDTFQISKTNITYWNVENV